MPDYKEMYLRLLLASTQALELLISAQRECEEIYISSEERRLIVIQLMPEQKSSAEEE